jgi:hypothetical protein
MVRKGGRWMKQLPVAVGLLLCEQVIIEKGTENVTLVNCFRERRVKQFPSEPLSFVTYAILTNGLGDIALTIAIQGLEDFKDVQRFTKVCRFGDPFGEFRCTVDFRNIVFPVGGAYQVVLLADNEFVAHRRFTVNHQGE